MNTIYSFWGKEPSLYKAGCAVTFLGREQQLRQRTVEKLQLQPGDTVIDVACGTGLNLRYLQESVGAQGKIIGVDYSAEMLKAAEENVEMNGWKNVQLHREDAATFHLEYEVDGVLSTLGISAISHHQEVLRQAVEMLKPGKRVVILDAQPFQGAARVLNPLIKAIYKPLANWDYTKNIVTDLESLVGKVNVEWHNGRTIYIAMGIKQ